MGVVERAVDLGSVEAKEPGAQPVVVAVLENPEVRRRGHDESGVIGERSVAQGGPRSRSCLPGVSEEGKPAHRRAAVAIEAPELLCEAGEHVALGPLERGPPGEVAHVAWRHAEGVRHEVGEVAPALAVKDPGQRRGEEPIRSVGEVQAAADEQELSQRARVIRERHFERDQLAASVDRSSRPSAGDGDAGHGHGVAAAPAARAPIREGPARRVGEAGTKRLPGVSLERPVDPAPRQAGRCLAGRGWIDFRGGEHVGERIEVVANAQAPLDTGLEGHRSSTRERVEDHVPGARVPLDEGVGERRREAGEIGAHRVEGMAPQAVAILPVGLDREPGKIPDEVQAQLGGRSQVADSAKLDRRSRAAGPGRLGDGQAIGEHARARVRGHAATSDRAARLGPSHGPRSIARAFGAGGCSSAPGVRRSCRAGSRGAIAGRAGSRVGYATGAPP